MKRKYDLLLAEHLSENRQMAFLTGPRQVGKTTVARNASPTRYFNWDVQTDRTLLTRGATAVADAVHLTDLHERPPVLVFDELHKYPKWKSFLKGLYDAHGEQCRMIVTGSARLNVYKRGGDSLMGRYFAYRMHPLSVGEILNPTIGDDETVPPRKPAPDTVEALLRYGGFPEPFLKASSLFHNRWEDLRTELLFREDIRDLTRIHESGQIQTLATLLQNQTGQLMNYSSLANAVNVSIDTICRWIAVLESFYFCFTIRPWHRNVPKSLRKQPKVFLWDWSMVLDTGARHENFVASHLLKAVHWWSDRGLGRYGLFYLRDKAKREVDFLVTKDDKPWLLVEVKTAAQRDLNPNLAFFQHATGAKHAFQAVFDMPYVDRDCFALTMPIRVPVATLLSQLP